MNQLTAPAARTRLLPLPVADLPSDDRAVSTRVEWINPARIESVVGYVTWSELVPVLWLELTLSSGIVRYTPIGPIPVTAGVDDATAEAVEALFPA